MKWNIIADSSCDLLALESNISNINYSSVPFILTIDNQDFVDDLHLDTSHMLSAMNDSKTSSHSGCPSPQNWLEQYGSAENILCITISSKLSGSYNSATFAKKIDIKQNHPRNVAIIDSHSTGPACVLLVRKLCQLIEKDLEFSSLLSQTEQYREHIRTTFALSSFDNLVKSGRMNKITGILAKTLKFWGVGIEENGKIKFKKKVRGKKHVVDTILEDMCDNQFSEGDVVISHCHNLSLAKELQDTITKKWPTAHITILPTRGLNSYYAELGGLIISYTSKTIPI